MMQAVNGRPVTYGPSIQVRAFTFLKRPVELSTGPQFDAWVYEDEEGVKRAPRWVRFALDDAHNKYTRRITPLTWATQKLDDLDPIEQAERRALIERAQGESEQAYSDYLTDVAMILIEGIDETTANSVGPEELDALFTELGYFKRIVKPVEQAAEEQSKEGEQDAAPLNGGTSQPDSSQPIPAMTT